MPLICFLLLLVHSIALHAQVLHIRGKIKCANAQQGSTRGADQVLIVPDFNPVLATQTASFPSGYFEFSTQLKVSQLLNKTIALTAISRCTQCREVKYRLFVDESMLTSKGQGTDKYLTVRNWQLKQACDQVMLRPQQADSIMLQLQQLPVNRLDHMSSLSALSSTPALLNFLGTTVSALGASGIQNERYKIESMDPADMTYGRFLATALMVFSPNRGLNLAASRDMSDAAFWNPATLVADPTCSSRLDMQSNYRNHARISGAVKVKPALSIHAAALWMRQQEFRGGLFRSGFLTRDEDSMSMHLHEWTAQAGASYLVSQKFSAGMQVKVMGQVFTTPDSLICDAQGKGTFEPNRANTQAIDIDLYGLYKLHPQIRVGWNLMNVLGSRLYKDSYLNDAPPARNSIQRSVAAGIAYTWQRFQAGADILWREDGWHDLAIGAQWIPFNEAMISAGYSLRQKSPSLSLRFKHFRISYLDDRGLLKLDARSPKAAILRGVLSGGIHWKIS